MVANAAIKFNEVHDEEFEKNFKENLLEKEISDFSKEFQNQPKKGSCPCCESKNLETEFSCLGFDHSRCQDCDTLFIDPCPPEDRIIDFLNNSKAFALWREMPEHVKKSRMKMYHERLAQVKSIIAEHSPKKENLRVLEIGSGNGEMAELMCEDDLFSEIHMIEPQELNLKHDKINLFRGSFAEFKKPGAVDVVISYEVLEHLVEPEDYFKLAQESLAPGGIFIFTTPNGDSLEIKVLQQKSPTVPFDHIRLYTPKALRNFMERFSFETLELKTPGKFDVDIILRNGSKGPFAKEITLFEDFLNQNEEFKQSLQKFLVEKQQSSHMVCVAKKK
ncbi:MAG: class I SAM-dependent methyltransferase [Deltaproteobacteria bacterium]|nr:class I SAM-dependent methyltransferase [Deltaproteobacteria bacterium]